MNTAKDYLNVLWTWLCWNLFALVRLIFHSIDLVIFNRRLNLTQSEKKLALVSKILFRYRSEHGDFAYAGHFLCKRQYLAKAETVINSDRVVLHCLDRHFATFVELPKPLTDYSASNVPFAFMQFFQDAIRTITIPISELHQLADQCGDVQTPSIIAHNVPRSGSTLFCKLMAASNPGILALSEPDAFTCLAFMVMDSHSYEDDHRIIRSVLRVFCRKMEGVDAFFLKMRGNVHILSPYIDEVAPQIKQVVIRRRNAVDTAASYARVFDDMYENKVAYLASNYPRLRPLLPSTLDFPPPIEQAAAEAGLGWSMFEIMCRKVAREHLLCQSHDKYFKEKFYYEDIVSDATRTIEITYDLLGLKMPNLNGQVIQKCMKQDSQAKTKLSWAVAQSKKGCLEAKSHDPELKSAAEKFFMLLPLKDIIISTSWPIK